MKNTKKFLAKLLVAAVCCAVLVSSLSSCEISEELINSLVEQYLGGSLEDILGELDISDPIEDDYGYSDTQKDNWTDVVGTDPTYTDDNVVDTPSSIVTDIWMDGGVVPPPEDLDFEGVEVGIAGRPETRYRREISVETPTNPLDMAINMRNTNTEKQLNVKITFIEADELWGTSTDANIYNYTKKQMDLGAQSNVDVILGNAAYTVNTNMLGLLADFNDKTEMLFVNTSKAYWNQSYVNEATFYDQLYYLVGDLTLSIYDKAHVTFVNFDLAAEKLGATSDEFYNAVSNGTWTIQKYHDYVTEFPYLDRGTVGEVDAADDIAISTIFQSESYDGYYTAFGLDLLKENSDGSHTITVAGNTLLDKATIKIHELYSEKGIFHGNTETAFSTFHAGNALFLTDILYRNEVQNEQLRAGTDLQYGILPLPLWEQGQFNKNVSNLGYRTSSQDAHNAISVIKTHPEKFEAVSATLELLAYKSYEDIRPYYVKRFVQDAGSANMLGIIMDSVTFNAEMIYSFNVDRFAIDLWRQGCNGTDIETRWESIRPGAMDAVESFDLWYQMNAK